MDLTKISNSELGSRLVKLAKTERKITHLVLWHILEFQSRKIYLDIGYSSMIVYLVKHLGYCETSARNRLNAAQLLKKAPEVVEQIESGRINLSQMNQVQRHIRQEEESGKVFTAAQAQDLLQKLENQNTFETQKTLAVAFDVPLKMSTIVKPQKDGSVRMEITFTEEQFRELETARQMLAHVCPQSAWPEVIAELAEKYNRSKLGKCKVFEFPSKMSDASLRAENVVEGDKEKKKKQKARLRNRPYISIKIKRSLLQQAKHQCEYLNPKTRLRCDARHALQVDHRIPLALGGSHKSDNLRILCRSHNLLMARKWGLARTSVSKRDSKRD